MSASHSHLGGWGTLYQNVSKGLFQSITGKVRGKINEAKAQKTVKENCNFVDGFFTAPNPLVSTLIVGMEEKIDKGLEPVHAVESISLATVEGGTQGARHDAPLTFSTTFHLATAQEAMTLENVEKPASYHDALKLPTSHIP